MSNATTDWDERIARYNAKKIAEAKSVVNPRWLALRKQGYSNHQIAAMTGARLSDVNLNLGQHNMRGR